MGKRPAYGHQHRNVSHDGKKSGKPRNLGQWFTHQLESKKPLTHHRSKKKAVRKSKKKKDTAHKIALRAMKRKIKKKHDDDASKVALAMLAEEGSQHEAMLKQSLKKAQAAELLATHVLDAARKRRAKKVSNGEEFEGDDMLHDLVKAQA